MKYLLLLLSIFNILSAYPSVAHSEVHFVTDENSDLITHPAKLQKHATFKIRIETPSPTSSDSEINVYVDNICKESLWPVRICETFGPISLEAAKQFMQDNLELQSAMFEDLETVDKIYSDDEGVDKGALQLVAMIPVVGFIVIAPQAIKHERLLNNFNEKYSAFMLVFATQGRDVYYFKNKYEDYYNFSSRLKAEMSQM